MRFRWIPPFLLFVAGGGVFAWKVRMVAPIRYVGHADASAYAEMADSLLHGRGLEVEYISWHFRRYSPRIRRPEDHWPPFYSFLIVPFFATMGKKAFPAKLPSLLLSSFGFPLAVYGLARRVSRSSVVGFVSGLSILLYLPVFEWSLHGLSDVTFGFLATAAVGCAVRGFEDSRWFLPMGGFLAASYLAKGSALVLTPPIGVYYVFWRLLGRPHRAWTRRDKNFVVGMGLSLGLLVPWFTRNTIHFGNPLYSTQNHAAGYIGWKEWEEGTYTLYWGESPPSLLDKARQPLRWLQTTIEFAKRHFWWLFVRMGGRWGEFDSKSITTYGIGLPALVGIGLFGVGGAVGGACRLRRRPGGRLWQCFRPFFRPEYALLGLVGVAHVGFLSVCWEPIDRLLSPVIPWVMLIGWTTLWTLFRERFGKVAPVLVVLGLGGFWANAEVKQLQDAQANRGYPWREADIGWQKTGDYIRTYLPGSVTMTRNPWELHFYSEEKAIQIPLAPLERIIEVARYYGVTHLIPERRRPTLEPWVKGEIPGLKRIFESNGVELYEINYRALPPHLLRPIKR